MAVVLISFALHPSGHYLYLILLTGSWGAGTSSECVMQKGGTKDENDGKRLTGLDCLSTQPIPDIYHCHFI